MKKGNGKKTLRAVLAAALGTVMLMSLAWAGGVTDVTGGTVTNTYTHTYHTKVIGLATINFVDDNGVQAGDVTSVDYESDFVVGNISDAAVQAKIAEFNGKVNAVIGDRRVNLERDEKKLKFDHFESSNIIDTSGESILVGDTEALEEAVQGGVSKNLDVHEYQRYTITQEYTVYATQIAAIRLENATLTFKAGDVPRFTGTVPEGACYTLARQSWFEDKEGGKGVTTDPNYTEYVGKELTAFAAGQRYTYLAKVSPQSGYTVSEDCKFFLNGQEVFVRTESGSQDEPFVRRFNDGEYFFAHMTPEQASSGRSYGGPHITPLLTAPDAKSATDYSGGIYGLTFKSSASFPSFLGVQVDGRTIDKSCYIAEEGSIEVYLKAVYLRTLAAGKHTMTILSSEGDATTEFTIGGLNTAPKTFDAGTAVYGVTAVLSLGGMAWMGKKKEL